MESIEFINVIDVPLTRAAVALLFRLHQETGCGDHGIHWTECDVTAAALGFEDYDDLIDQIDQLQRARIAR